MQKHCIAVADMIAQVVVGIAVTLVVMDIGWADGGCLEAHVHHLVCLGSILALPSLS
jgi:hypothetical protein